MLGPDNVAAITDPDIAEADPGFAVFSAITHSRSRQIDVILETLAGALSTVDEETGSLLAEFTEAGLGDTDRTKHMEETHGDKHLPVRL